MERREFSRALGMGVLAASGLAAWPALAQGKKPENGADYLTLDKAAPVDTAAGKVEVLEFFWYSCPHCNAFEPTLDAWVKAAPKDLFIRRVPVAFNASFVPQQKLFYTLEGMGKLEALHAKVFRAIHVEKAKLAKDDEIFAWVAQQGVDAAKFKEVYTSFTVSNQVRRASQLQDAYGVEGVPSMGVAGKFYTDGTMAGNMQNVLQVVEALVKQK